MTTLTLAPDTQFARMRIVVESAVGGDLLRDGEPVRGGLGLTGDAIVDDYEVPFGVDVTYTLDGQSATGRLTMGVSALSHPTDPLLTVTGLTVETDDDWQWTAPGTAHQVLGSEWPVVTFSRRTEHNGRLVLITSYADRQPMRDILVTGSPLLLRVPPGCPVDDMWLWPQTATRSFIGPPNASGNVRWLLDYQRVTKPGGEVVVDPGNAWAAYVQTHTDWADGVAEHADWLDAVLDPHPHAS